MIELLKGLLVNIFVSATPVTAVAAQLKGGRVRSCIDKVEVTAGALATSTYTLGRLPMNAILMLASSIRIDDLASSGAPLLDVGLSPVGGNFPVNATALSASTITGATAGAYDLVLDIDNAGKQLWEILGLATNPGGEADVLVTITDAACNTGGTIVSETLYSVD